MILTYKNCVIFTYPKMGKSGEFLPDELKNLNGLTGCSNQCKAFNENLKKIKELGFELIAISSQDEKSQNEFKKSLNLDFIMLSDEKFKFENELGLKTFKTLDNKKFYHRQTLIFKDNKLIKCFDFVLQPEENAKEVVEFLQNL